MSIFFWRKKKDVPETEEAVQVTEPSETTAAEPSEPADSAKDPAAAEEPSAGEEAPAKEPAAAEEPSAGEEAPAKEPAAAEEPSAGEEAPVEEPAATDEPSAEEPAPSEEPVPETESEQKALMPRFEAGSVPEEHMTEKPAAEGPAAELPAKTEDTMPKFAAAPAEEPAAPAEEQAEEPTAAEEPAVEPTAAQAEEPTAAEEPAMEPVAAPVEEPTAAEEPAVEPVVAPAEEPTAAEEPAVEPVVAPAEEPTAAEEPAVEPVATPVEEPVAPAEEYRAEETPAEESTPFVYSTPDPEEDDYVEKRHRSKAPLLIFLLLCVIGWSYYYGMVYAETHFLENTYINGIDVSNMTSPQVEKLLAEKAVDYQLTLTFRDGATEVITGNEIGYKVKPDGSVDKILRSQDNRRWYKCFFRRTDGQVQQKMTYDPDRLREAVGKLPELQESNMIKPVDAYIELTGTTFNIIPEVEGDTIDVELVQKAAEAAVRREEPEVDVTAIEGSYAEPKVRAADKDIVEKCDGYNKMLAGSITWKLPNGETMTINADDTVKWLSVDDNGNYYRDEDQWEENIAFWVDELARNVNTVGKTWNFHATDVGDIEIDGGDYGYSVDKETEKEEVWDLLWDGETEERDPYFYQKQYSSGSGIGSTYIEANLSKQHVWIYIDGAMVCETDCVSGLPSGGRGTPTGVYQILYKDTDTDLKGQPLGNGQYSYISHVDYWMPFYGGCGFHDASWRSSFGGNIYTYDGSHGCINLPPSIAGTFYNYVQTGMPVVVFY